MDTYTERLQMISWRLGRDLSSAFIYDIDGDDFPMPDMHLGEPYYRKILDSDMIEPETRSIILSGLPGPEGEIDKLLTVPDDVPGTMSLMRVMIELELYTKSHSDFFQTHKYQFGTLDYVETDAQGIPIFKMCFRP